MQCTLVAVVIALALVGCGRPYEAPLIEMEPAGSYAVGEGPYTVRLGDLDGDGTLDAATANLIGGTITWLRSKDGPVPSRRYELPTGGTTVALALGDFDGDTLTDVAGAVRSEFGHLAIFHGRLAAVPGKGPRIRLHGSPNDVAAADLDSDGRDELIVALRESAIAVVSMGPTRGDFRVERYDIPDCGGASDYGPDGVHLADLDGDLDIDAAVVCYASWSIHLLQGDGFGGFGEPVRLGQVTTQERLRIMRAVAPSEIGENDSPAGGFRKLVSADLDTDGYVDLLAVGDYGVLSAVFGSQWGFGPMQTISTGVDGTNNVAIGDVDRDGAPEVLFTTGHENTILIGSAKLLRRGTMEVRRTGVLPQTPECIQLADLDGDGYLDAVVVGEHASAAQFLRGDGNGDFGPWRTLRRTAQVAGKAEATEDP